MSWLFSKSRLLALMTLGACLAALVGYGASSAGKASAKAKAAASSVVVTTTNPMTPTAANSLPSLTWWLYYRAPQGLDPLKVADYPESMILSNLCEGDLRLDPGFKLAPALVTSYKYATPTKVVLTVRQGVKFWNGTPMTAADVAFSLERNLEPSVGSLWSGWVTQIKSVIQTGRYQVTINLKRPDTTPIEQLSEGEGIVISKQYYLAHKSTYGTQSGSIMCTGPFKLQSWTQNQLVIVRNDNYWNKAMLPKTKKITFVWPTDPGQVTAGFQAGSFDGGYEIQPAQYSSLLHTNAGQMYIGNENMTFAFDWIQSTGTGPMASAKVRLALSDVIDRAAIAKSIYDGEAAPAYALAGPGYWGYERNEFAAAYKQYEHGPNIGAAKKLLQQAGPIAKQPLGMVVESSDPLQVEEASIIQQEGNQVGMHIHVIAMPAAEFASAIFAGKTSAKFNAILYGAMYDPIPDPIIILHDAGYSKSNNNLGFKDPALDKLILQAQGEQNLAKRAQMAINIQKIEMTLMPDIPLVSPYPITFVGKRITGMPDDQSYFDYPWAASIGGR